MSPGRVLYRLPIHFQKKSLFVMDLSTSLRRSRRIAWTLLVGSIFICCATNGCQIARPLDVVTTPAGGGPSIAADALQPALVQRLPPVENKTYGMIRLVSHQQDTGQPEEIFGERLSDPINANLSPIDLANALALGGATAWQIRIARQQVLEAQAKFLKARVLWLPTLRGGVGYNRHDGQIQATEGEVIQAGRNSLFIGGGAGLGSSPLTGNSGGPPRFFVSLSLADAYFEPLIENRTLGAKRASQVAITHNTLTEISAIYFDLVEAHGLLANAEVAVSAGEKMYELTAILFCEGAGAQADVDRALAQRDYWNQLVEDRKRITITKSAELINILRLDPMLTLVPVEENIVPLEVIPPDLSREMLLAQGLANRPELAQQGALIAAAARRAGQEHWRPWLPNLTAGADGGTFGGGRSHVFTNQAGRGDLDLLAVWEWENLGLGNYALNLQRASQLREARYKALMVKNQVAAEIVSADANVRSYRQQIDIALRAVGAASDSYTRNFERLQADEALPIELWQAINARADAQDDYTEAVSSYNRSQFELLRAVGQSAGQVPLSPDPTL